MFYTINDIINEANKIFQMADFVNRITFTCKGDLGGEIEVYRDGGYSLDLQKPPSDPVVLCEGYYRGKCDSDNCPGYDADCEDYRHLKKDEK